MSAACMAGWIRRWHRARGHRQAPQNIRNLFLPGYLHTVITCSCGRAWTR